MAFSKKEKAARLLEKLEELRAAGEVDDEQFGLMKEEYEQLAREGDIELEGLRGELERDIEAARKELALYEKERANVELRIKVGELSAKEAVRQERRAQGKTRKLEVRIEDLEKLLAAESSEDTGGFIDVPVKGRRGPRRRTR